MSEVKVAYLKPRPERQPSGPLQQAGIESVLTPRELGLLLSLMQGNVERLLLAFQPGSNMQREFELLLAFCDYIHSALASSSFSRNTQAQQVIATVLEALCKFRFTKGNIVLGLKAGHIRNVSLSIFALLDQNRPVPIMEEDKKRYLLTPKDYRQILADFESSETGRPAMYQLAQENARQEQQQKEAEVMRQYMMAVEQERKKLLLEEEERKQQVEAAARLEQERQQQQLALEQERQRQQQQLVQLAKKRPAELAVPPTAAAPAAKRPRVKKPEEEEEKKQEEMTVQVLQLHPERASIRDLFRARVTRFLPRNQWFYQTNDMVDVLLENGETAANRLLFECEFEGEHMACVQSIDREGPFTDQTWTLSTHLWQVPIGTIRRLHRMDPKDKVRISNRLRNVLSSAHPVLTIYDEKEYVPFTKAIAQSAESKSTKSGLDFVRPYYNDIFELFFLEKPLLLTIEVAGRKLSADEAREWWYENLLEGRLHVRALSQEKTKNKIPICSFCRATGKTATHVLTAEAPPPSKTDLICSITDSECAENVLETMIANAQLISLAQLAYAIGFGSDLYVPKYLRFNWRRYSEQWDFTKQRNVQVKNNCKGRVRVYLGVALERPSKCK